jgi:hypothetical protein
MSRLNINNLTNENEDGSPRISGISTFSSTAFLEAPKGTTAERPENVAPGMIRFNTDSGHLEYYTGEFWDEVLVANNTLDGGNRGVFGNGNTPALTATMEYITISTLGNALTFGNTSDARDAAAALSSSTRGLISGGYLAPSTTNNIRYITISSTGDSTTFGNLSANRNAHAGCASATRGLWGGGSPVQDTIEYITISSLGNTQDFGNLIQSRYYLTACSSSVRGVFAGGYTPTPTATSYDVIDYVTIASTGDAQDFGNLTRSSFNLGGLSNSTRGLFGGGTPSNSDVIDYITIATLGDAVDFGDLTVNRRPTGAASSPTRGVWSGGTPVTDVIDYVTILSTGDAVDFGDLIESRATNWGLSNGHGGL